MTRRGVKMSDKTTFVSFLLDETGSMQAIKDATIDGFNAYLETLQGGEADILFSLVTFNSNQTQRRYVADPIRKVKPLRARQYKPDAMTPLIDAAVKIIKATDEAVEHRGDDPNVVIVMQTDGMENVSVEYTVADLAALIKEKKEARWEFVFLGAGLDAFAAARQAGIHIAADQVLSYSGRLSRSAFAATAKNVQDFAESGGDAAFLGYSKAQRKTSGDEHTQQYLDPDAGGSARSSSPRRPKRPARKERNRGSTVEHIDLSKP